MAEFITMEQAEDKFGKKGIASTGLGLGIAGTALGLLGLHNGGGLFNGGGNPTCANLGAIPSLWEICDKQNKENVALTAAIYQGRIQEMKDLADVYERLNQRLVEVEKKDAALEASLPLAMKLASVEAERYADDKVCHAIKHQSDMNFFLQREIDKRVVGTLGLPYSSIISGIPTMPTCTFDVTCDK